jgi:endonuclease/exonuclease/phosphatase family metal-dependent hydrolase
MKKLIYITCLAAFFGLCFCGCKYNTDIAHPEKYVQVYMPQAAKNPVTSDFIMSDSMQTIIYGANYGGTGYPDKNITVKFKVNTALVDSFNKRNETSYLPLPGGSYTLEASTSIIPKGKVSTDPLELKIKTIGALETGVEYLLPLQIIQADNDSVSSSLGVTYYVIKATYRIVNVLMSKGGNTAISKVLNTTDSLQTITYTAEYNGNDPAGDITLHFKADTTLSDSFNLKNGTAYPSMPEGSYSLTQTTAAIPEGTTTTPSLSVKVKTKGVLTPFQQYLLPVRIDTVTGSLAPDKKLVIDKNKGVAYFLIEATKKGVELTVMSYGKGSGFNDMQALAGTIINYKPDLLVVREMDVNTTRSGPADQPEKLAELLGYPYHVFANALDYQGGEYGTAVFSKFPLVASETKTYMLPSSKSEKGPLAIIKVLVNDSLPLYFAGVHLNANSTIRNDMQVPALLDIMKNYPGPIIRAGDFNANPDNMGDTYGQMASQFTFPCHSCPPNYPASAPKSYSDYIMYKTGIEFTAESYRVGDTSVSSHLPVILKVKWYY